MELTYGKPTQFGKQPFEPNMLDQWPCTKRLMGGDQWPRNELAKESPEEGWNRP